MGLPNLYELIRVDNVRAHPRFVVDRPLEGDLHGQVAKVRNLSIGGFGLAHASQLRVGSTTRFDLRDTEFGEVIPFRLTVMWIRMSGGKSKSGEMAYHSGLQIKDDLEQIGGKLGRLLRYYGKPEANSMEIKKINALSRLMKRVSVERKQILEIDPEVLLLSYQALDEVSRMEPEQMQVLTREASEELAASSRPDGWSRDVLAAWKLIDCKIEPPKIERARKILDEIDRFTQEHG